MRCPRQFITLFAIMTTAVGCAGTGGDGGPSLAEEGWTQVGQVTAMPDQDRAVLRAESLPGRYQSICIETDGPLIIERLGASFTDTTTFQSGAQFSFAGPDRRVVEMPGEQRQIMYVVLVYSGGRSSLGTKFTVWVR